MNTHYFNAENLCQLLIHSREQAHKTQRYMAKALRRSIQTIQNWEYGISAPDVLDFQAWFEVLGMNPLFYILTLLSPDVYSDTDEDTQIETALLHYIKNVAPASEKRKLAFCIFGNSGSSWSSQLDEFTAINCCSMRTRVTVSQAVYDSYVMEKAQGKLLTTDKVKPDLANLKSAIDAGRKSAMNGNTGYIQECVPRQEETSA